MTYFIQACVKDGHIFTVRAQTHPVVGYCVLETMDFVINAEIDGEQLDALEVLSSLRLSGQTLSGLVILNQTILPAFAG